ncbi:MAG: hypothetical protein ACO3PY_05475 [Pontimonas sp.]
MKSAPRLIGLYSPAPSSGKSTVASYLTEHGFYTVPFARPIKLMVRTFLIQLGYGPTEIDHYLDAGKKDVIDGIRTTPRQLMQTLGTEWGRQCVHPQVWLMCWERLAQQKLDLGISVVCDDVRFPNEAALIRRLGGELWRIERPSTERGTSHASEGSLDDYPLFDRRLTNDGTLLRLYGQVQQIVTPVAA